MSVARPPQLLYDPAVVVERLQDAFPSDALRLAPLPSHYNTKITQPYDLVDKLFGGGMGGAIKKSDWTSTKNRAVLVPRLAQTPGLSQ